MLTDKDLELSNIKGISEVFNQRIYKYVGYEDAIKYVLIDKNTLKFSSPNDFNDPFDCYEGFVNFSNVPPSATLDDTAKRLLDRSIVKEASSRTKQVLNDRRARLNFFKEQKKDYRVSCFSKVYDEVLMWSHYANKHTGVCIGFEFPIEPLPKDFIVFPVVYKDSVQPFDVYANPFRIILHWIITKSHHWKYEKEVRAIIKNDSRKLLNDGNNYYYVIEKDWIKEIVFGCKVSDKVVEKTIKLIRKNGFKNILIKRMFINPDNFSLEENIIADIQNYKNKVK